MCAMAENSEDLNVNNKFRKINMNNSSQKMSITIREKVLEKAEIL